MNTNINVEGFNNLSPEIQQTAELIRKGYLLEEWRPVINYNLKNEKEVSLNVEISRSGIVRRIDTKRNYLQSISNGGYVFVTIPLIYKTEIIKYRLRAIHSLLMSTFIGPRPATNYVIDHIDRDRSNFKLNNLRYVTPSENNLNKDSINVEKNVLLDIKTNKLYTPTDFKNKISWENLLRSTKDDPDWALFKESAYNYVINNNIDISNVLWKKLIDEFPKGYHYISNVGVIRIDKHKRPYYKIGSVTTTGYRKFSGLDKNNNRYFVHRLVAKYFLNNGVDIDDKLFVDHIDTNRENNLLDNLRIVTPSENMKNIKSILKTSIPIKLSTIFLPEKILYFSSLISAGLYIKAGNTNIKKWIDGKTKCPRKDITYISVWNEEDYLNYNLGKIEISDGIETPYKNFDGIGYDAISHPIKALKDDGKWYYFRSKADFGKYINTDVELIRQWISGKYKCSKGYVEFSDWNEDDWKSYYSGTLEIVDASNIPFIVPKILNSPIKVFSEKDNCFLYFTNKISFSKYVDVAATTVDHWFRKTRNCSKGFSQFSLWSSQDWDNYKNGKIKITL